MHQVFNLKYAAQAQLTDPSGNSLSTGLPKVDANNASVQVILTIVFGVIGAAAVLFIIIAAIKYVTSQGDPQATARAKSTIIYAAIGLVIALSAETIVTFVLGNV